MKRTAYQLKAGNINNLKAVEKEVIPPGKNEVTVAVKAIGLNFADIFAMFGLYSATPKGIFVPGLEYAGEVIQVGEGINHLKIGDRVMGVTRFGAYTTHITTDYRYLIPVPESWTMAEGAAYLVQVLTAYYGLCYLGRLEKGETVLIHSAAGGVGILANRIAKKFDAFTIGSVGSERKVDFCKKEGYDRVIVRSNRFEKDLSDSLGERDLNVVMECIGGEIFKAGFKMLGPQGRMVVYGAAQYASPGQRPNYAKVLYKYFTRPKIDAQSLAELNKSVAGFNLIYLYERVELMNKLLSEIEQLDIAKPHVGHTFPFEQIGEAIKLFQSGQTIGKVVVEV